MPATTLRPPLLPAATLRLRSELLAVLALAIRDRNLTQARAAEICGTSQPVLCRALRGRPDAVTAETLLAWLAALGLEVAVRIQNPAGKKTWRRAISVSPRRAVGPSRERR